MTPIELEALCAHWPGVTIDVKWQHNLVFSVSGKMFCIIGLQAHDQHLSFKVDDARFLELTDRHGVRPAPYLARLKWVTVDSPRSLPQSELDELIGEAYRTVAARLAKKTQRELGLLA